jgi:predicted Fe-Mo cluster-binding NifX family protein
MKTAFAHWDHRIAPVFDTARELFLVYADSGQVFSETVELPTDDLPVRKVLRLVELKVATLVCGAISRPMYGAVVAYGIQVIPFVAGDLDEVIQAWLGGKLENDRFSMPGCCERGGRRFKMMQGRQREEDIMNARGRGMGAGRRSKQGGKGTGRMGVGPMPGGRMGGPMPAGTMGGPMEAGPVGFCVCPDCGQQVLHIPGLPCFQRTCAACGAIMARQ